MSARIKQYKDQLENFLKKDNAFNNVLAKIEEKTKINRIHLFLGFSAVFALYLIFGYGAALIVNALGAVYPAYCSIKAVESVSKDDDTQWLIYWIVYAVFTIVEHFTDFFLSWFPFYFLAKLLFLGWCMAPFAGNGSALIYNKFIKPFVLKYQSEIDEVLEDTQSVISSATEKVMNTAKNEALKHYMKGTDEVDHDKPEDEEDKKDN